MFKKILVFSLLLRLLIVPFFYHPDIKTFNFQASFLSQGVFDIYGYLAEKKPGLAIKEEFVYFPLTYFILGGYQFLVSPLLGSNFNNWISDASVTAVEANEVFRYLLLLKLPLIFFDLVIGFLIYKLWKKKEEGLKIATVWLLNPFSLIVLYMYSNVDIYPVFLSVLSVLLFLRKKYWIAGLLIGIAAAFKAYPLLILPFYILFIPSIKDRILTVASGLGSFGLILLPFIGSSAFHEAALVSGLTTRILFENIPFGFNEFLILPVVILAGLFFMTWMKERKTSVDFIIVNFVVYAVVLAFIHYHSQWLLWLLPFGSMIYYFYPKLRGIFILLGLIFLSIPVLYSDAALSIRLLTPISALFSTLPMPSVVVNKIYDVTVIINVLKSVLIAGVLVVGIYLLKEKSNEEI